MPYVHCSIPQDATAKSTDVIIKGALPGDVQSLLKGAPVSEKKEGLQASE